MIVILRKIFILGFILLVINNFVSVANEAPSVEDIQLQNFKVDLKSNSSDLDAFDENIEDLEEQLENFKKLEEFRRFMGSFRIMGIEEKKDLYYEYAYPRFLSEQILNNQIANLKLQKHKLIRQLDSNIDRLYFTYQMLENQLDLLQKSIDLKTEIYKQQKLNYTLGNINKAQYLESKNSLKETKINIEKLKLEKRTLELNILKLGYKDLSKKYNFKKFTFLNKNYNILRINEYIQEALEKNLDLKLLQKKEKTLTHEKNLMEQYYDIINTSDKLDIQKRFYENKNNIESLKQEIQLTLEEKLSEYNNIKNEILLIHDSDLIITEKIENTDVRIEQGLDIEVSRLQLEFQLVQNELERSNLEKNLHVIAQSIENFIRFGF